MEISVLGCGWLGLPLAGALVDDGHDVRGSTTSPEKLDRIERAGVEPHLLRLTPQPQGDVDAFFASELLIVTMPPGDGYLERLSALLEAARHGGARWCIFTSSTSVYGDAAGIVGEDDLAASASERSRLLRDAEALFSRAALDATVLRLGGLFGGDRQPGRFLAGRTEMAGASAPVNLVHRCDVIGVVRAVIDHDARNQVFNVVADEHPTKRDFYRSSAVALGLEPPTFAAEPDDGPARHKVVSNEKTKTALGYTFRHQPAV